MKPWPTKKLGEICKFIFGFSFKAEDFNEAGRGLPVIRIGDIDKGFAEKFYDKEYDKRYLVDNGDILIGLSGSIKVDKWRGGRALLNQRVVRICNFKKDVLGDFIFYQLPKILKRLEIQISQGTIKNVLSPHLANLKILIPSLKIQRQIVERLDAIKRAQELNDKQIELAEELFQSLLHRELDQKGKNWEEVRVKDVIEKIEYGLSISIPNRLDDSGIPIISMADIDLEGNIDYEKVRKIKISKKELEKFRLNRNDLLFNWRNSKEYIGKTALFNRKGDFVFASFLLRIITNNKILPKFLWLILNDYRRKGIFVGKARQAVSQSNFNATELGRLIKIPLPPIETQKKIVEKLSAVQEYKKKLLEQKQKLKELFESVLNESFITKQN